MHYDAVFDKWHEECGVFGIYDRTLEAGKYIYWGLFALQHRGQESAGIAISNGREMALHKQMGLLTEAIKTVPTLDGAYMGVGHVRYSTTGSNHPKNIQPLVIHYQCGELAVAHNGNLTNALEIRRELDNSGSLFQTSMDSEVIVNLIARSRKNTVEERIIEAVNRITGAFSIVMQTNQSLIGIRDPHGFRPLCLGKTKQGYVLASETCALDAIKAEFIRHLDPGEMVIIDETGVRSRLITDSSSIQKQLCVFEYIYFARSDSQIDGQSVYEARLNMGRELARETRYEADIVMSVPDSGTTAALGYARESGIPFAEGLIKNRYSGRTFIKPNQDERDLAVRMKLNAVPEVVKGKRIVLIDDSIVRGTTSAIIVKMLKEAGAKEIYMCVSSPTILYPCHYGIDTSVRKELIAATHSVEEIRQYIKADRLYYLSHEGLCRAISNLEEHELCFACFDGTYSVPVPMDQEGGVKYVLE
ncbi:amidophosphoribosyltransferase [Veillonella montpellierensis]|uniref:amidophosphoribosyltransferase n=1 Tax=Veillonella montpellierensis TaxID=187328 RepID=UPI0023F6F1B6|nr:amidophosphoribosyltransferase [Veillonella montpellierensis]